MAVDTEASCATTTSRAGCSIEALMQALVVSCLCHQASHPQSDMFSPEKASHFGACNLYVFFPARCSKAVALTCSNSCSTEIICINAALEIPFPAVRMSTISCYIDAVLSLQYRGHLFSRAWHARQRSVRAMLPPSLPCSACFDTGTAFEQAGCPTLHTHTGKLR